MNWEPQIKTSSLFSLGNVRFISYMKIMFCQKLEKGYGFAQIILKPTVSGAHPPRTQPEEVRWG